MKNYHRLTLDDRQSTCLSYHAQRTCMYHDVRTPLKLSERRKEDGLTSRAQIDHLVVWPPRFDHTQAKGRTTGQTNSTDNFFFHHRKNGPKEHARLLQTLACLFQRQTNQPLLPCEMTND